MGMERLLQERNTQLKITHVNLEPSLEFQREGERERGERERREGRERGEERERTLIPWDVTNKNGVRDIEHQLCHALVF